MRSLNLRPYALILLALLVSLLVILTYAQLRNRSGEVVVVGRLDETDRQALLRCIMVEGRMIPNGKMTIKAGGDFAAVEKGFSRMSFTKEAGRWSRNKDFESIGRQRNRNKKLGLIP